MPRHPLEVLSNSMDIEDLLESEIILKAMLNAYIDMVLYRTAGKYGRWIGVILHPKKSSKAKSFTEAQIFKNMDFVLILLQKEIWLLLFRCHCTINWELEHTSGAFRVVYCRLRLSMVGDPFNGGCRIIEIFDIAFLKLKEAQIRHLLWVTSFRNVWWVNKLTKVLNLI